VTGEAIIHCVASICKNKLYYSTSIEIKLFNLNRWADFILPQEYIQLPSPFGSKSRQGIGIVFYIVNLTIKIKKHIQTGRSKLYVRENSQLNNQLHA